MQDNTGQVGTEYMVVIAILLLATGIMATYALLNYNESFKVSQLAQTTASLEAAIEQVYALGPGNVLVVRVDIPLGIQGVSISGREAVYTLSLLSGNTQFSVLVTPDMSGSLPTESGVHYVRVESTSSGVVLSEV